MKTETTTIIKGLFFSSFAILSIILLPSTTFAERGFSSGVNYDTGTSPRSVISCDLNGDTYIDLVVSNSDSNNISILLGNGDGSFDFAVNYNTGTWPRSVTLGDFNRDTYLDLVVVNSGSNNISILLGNGDGSFDFAVNYNVGSYPSSIISGLFDGDVYLDLAVTNFNSSSISVLLGNGDGSFDQAVNSSASIFFYSVISGLFDEDTYLDLVVTQSASGKVFILLGNGDGSFDFDPAVNYTFESSVDSITSGLFDDDVYLDLVVTNGYNVSVLLGNGDGSFDRAGNYNYSAGFNPRSITSGLFDDDVYLDLVVVNGDNVSILLGNGDGSFDQAGNYTVESNVSSITSGLFDDDVYLDLAVANYSSNTVSILLNSEMYTPFPINDLLAVSTGLTSVALSWLEPEDGSSSIVGYRIERESPVGGGFTTLIEDTQNTDTTYTDLDLQQGTEYNYRVSAINIVGVGGVSNEASATTDILNIPEGITRISVSNNGEQGDGDSMNFSSLKTISGDGRYTVLNSYATNFTEEEVGTGVYLYDREATSEASEDRLKLINPFGLGPTISDNGMYVAYVELGESGLVIKIYNTDTGVTNTIDLHQSYNELLLQLGEEGLFFCTFSISNNGNILISPGTGLLIMAMMGGENPISIPPIVFYDSSIEEYITIAESEDTEESMIFNYSANISASGNDIIYGQLSDFPTLFNYNVLTRQTSQLELGGPALIPNISSTGRYISFFLPQGEINYQIGVYDTVDESFVLSESSLGADVVGEGSALTSISDDGRFVVISQPYITSMFSGGDYTFPSIYIFDSETNELIELVEGEGHFGAYISSDGKYITFSSDSDLLAEGDTNEYSDVFLIENPYFEEEQEPAPARTRTRSLGYASPVVLASFQQEQLQRAINAGLDTTPYQTNQTVNITTPINRTLKLGMQGDDVKALQVYLNTHGYPASLSGAGSLGNETIYFGLKTKQAVVKFQLANGLVGDGIVGLKTKEKMK